MFAITLNGWMKLFVEKKQLAGSGLQCSAIGYVIVFIDRRLRTHLESLVKRSLSLMQEGRLSQPLHQT
jgi:hypothetical protein